jgi:hypothetical protein
MTRRWTDGGGWPGLAWVLVLLALSPGGCGGPAARETPPKAAALAAGSREAVEYEATLRADGRLDVVARLPAGSSDRLFVEPGAEPFVERLEPRRTTTTPDLPGHGEPFAVDCARGCELRYRFDLPAAADRFDHVGYAARVGTALLAPPSTWLLHPRDGDLTRRFTLRVAVPPGQRFATGLPPVADPGGAAPSAVGATLADLPSAPYAAMGVMRTHVVDAGGASVEVALVGGLRAGGDGPFVAWAAEGARDVSELLGAPVVPHALVLVEVHPGRRLSLLTALGNGGASIHAPVGVSIDPAVLAADWRMTHEFVHLGSPGLHQRHTWFSEGLATYLEPIARVRRGRYRAESFWKEMVDSLPQGQPAAGDRGLDGNGTWGRTYWGGGLFCFVADVEARRLTDNAGSLPHAMAAVHAAGGDVRARWSMLHLIEVADGAIGHPVLGELYARHRDAAVAIDLDSMWRDLGVVRGAGGAITFDDAAPLAHVRRAITSR